MSVMDRNKKKKKNTLWTMFYYLSVFKNDQKPFLS